jgi:hypothetical protein
MMHASLESLSKIGKYKHFQRIKEKSSLLTVRRGKVLFALSRRTGDGSDRRYTQTRAGLTACVAARAIDPTARQTGESNRR